jgi:hypothetical protein
LAFENLKKRELKPDGKGEWLMMKKSERKFCDVCRGMKKASRDARFANIHADFV